ncbi:MAG TPA: alpha/beta hydrolase [Baekduia sp.]|uniref:alpha/beta fold hydrolase n=1 Tax=Baekduia sp. TaxID=2600305 RepID=UPI002C0B5309|nr:alpha/beta hydrolase [Baekduia sp.]HMJ34437.1 alpha/beta hydrolase [Baekduia sp.]
MLVPPKARRRTLRSWLPLALVTALLGVALLASPASAATKTSKPTVVLVHGAFADASGWAGVIDRLQDAGYPVVAPANPLRGVAADAAYVKSFLATVDGPIILVGHSYGGMVITNAATGNPNVKALVYVAAYAPDEGDTAAGLSALAEGGMIGPATLTIRTFPGADGTPTPEGYIKLDVFHKIFCADLPARKAAEMAVSQRPAAVSALGEPSGAPAWKTIPSWYMVAGKDLAIGTAAERIMARRIKATTVEVKGASHVVFISHPGATAKLIERAAGAKK